MNRLFSTFLLSALSAAAMADGGNKIYVDMGTKGNPVSKTMYGMFFEEINHAGDGGLYAEMIQNRGFEEQTIPGGMTYRDGKVYAPHSLNYYGLDYVDHNFDWDIETKKYHGWTISSQGCSLTKDVTTPEVSLNEYTPNALHLVISNSTSSSRVNVDNSGYWGVAVTKDAKYKLRFFMRTTDYTGSVKAILRSSTGWTVASEEFEVKSDGVWNEYTAELTASATFNDGIFRLQLSGDGTVDIDYVSLFPVDTYKGRENGLRKDIAEMLEGLNPAFLRWPGGCIVEGITLGNRVKWKETIGAPETRPGEYSLWGYRSTYGLGYYEFLQFCEDMGMDGMFVANVGMSCSIRNGDFIDPEDEDSLQSYLQDIRDAIDYAIGDPATNEWAALRSAAGHPEPFPLKYVELGNENGTERYSKRYAYFYNTLKSEYPDITFINTLTWGEASMIEKTDMFDVHWYVTPDEFYADATLFDTAERGDYTVYAGEYAANNDVGSGNMDAALSEAVFIGGMERNGDFVTMASYAPLLTNTNQPNWSCNLIWFDNDQTMGRASYYVQKLYSDNRPDYNVMTRIQSNGQKAVTRGCVGVGTWSTQAQFRNLKITSNDGTQTFYESDFLTREDEWSEKSGTWKVNSNGDYVQTSDGTPCISIMNAYSVGNCTFEVEARKIGGAEGFFMVFGTDTLDTSDYYRLNIGGWGNTQIGLEEVVNDGGTLISDRTNYTVATNRWYKLKVVMNEAEDIKLYIDDELVFTYDLLDILPGRVQAFGGYDEANGEMVIKVVNATDTVMPTDFTVNAANIQSEGKIILLASDDLSDENSLDNPTKISPVESTYNGFASSFTYDVQPRSLTIMRIKADEGGVDAIEIPKYEYSDQPIALSAAKVAKETAISNLEELVKYAESNYVDGTTNSSKLSSSISTSKELLATTGVTTKSLTTAYTNLETALISYFNALMTDEGDCTSKIENADFKTMSTTGWLGSTPSLEANVGEFFNCTFDMYQQLTGLENGYYLIYVQGFYRDGSGDVAYERACNNEGIMRVSLYGNDTSTKLRSLYSDGEDMGSLYGYCDNRTQAEAAFATSDETYANYMVVKVEDGTLKLGLKKSEYSQYDWACFNNFQLYHFDVESTGISNVNADGNGKMNNAVYNLSGQKLDAGDVNNRHGVFIINNKKVIR